MNLLITGAWADARASFPAIEAMGHRIVWLPKEQDPLPCDPAWVEGAVCNGLFLTHPLGEFPNLRYLQLTSAGLDRVPAEEIRARGIALHNARGVYSIPMAEFAVGGVLQLYKQSRFFYENQKAARWEKHRGLSELFGKTVTILGCGSVGSACAHRFAAFGCRVLGIDLYPGDGEPFEHIYSLSELERILDQTDVLVLTLPLTEQTRGLLSADRLSHLPDGAVVVNISRGGVADEQALIRALQTGGLAGAVLDVFAAEPLEENSPLWGMDNVILTPHNSFVGEGNAARLTACILRNLSMAER